MAKIPLRVYNHEIEQLIEKHQNQEAIAHCKQILKFHAKHIDTYRLLGKAFLESQRYGEASDILQRVLSVVPDDFLAQLGMSLIREDEGNLDGAIYHMERAFEVQPANAAIQEELRRLYGNRDGIQPPKIRLTRGALVRMYAKGELFTQAIAEATSALAEDPQRVDLQVLLARLYYQSGQRVKATEVSSELVDRLPYCYEANRILADVLPATSRPEESRVYQERLRALDPYLAFVSEAQPTSADVSDNAVMVEHLEYDPAQDEAAQPGWAQQVGVAWNETPAVAETPDWMNPEPTPTESQPADFLAPAGEIAEKADDLPDWMVAAGWQPSNGEEVETHLTEEPVDEMAAPASLPDWLQEMAPDLSQQAEAPAEEAEEDAQWLDQILGAAPVTAAAEEAPAEEIPAKETENVPDWLQEQPSAETPGVGSEAIPDWLQEQPSAETPDVGSEAVPDWLQEAGFQASADSTVEPADTTLPDWLAMESGETPQPTAAETQDWISDEVKAETDAEMPDWLKAIATDTQTPEEETAAVSPVEAIQDETVDITEAVVPVVEDFEAESTPPVSETEQPLAPPEDMDAALAWLESLAARQGADEATLITQPEQRGAEMPDWLQKEADASAQNAILDAELVEEQPAAEEDISPPEWMQELPAQAATDEVALPEWIQEQPAMTAEDVPAAAEEATLPEWLQPEATDSNAETPAAAEETAVPEWLQDQPAATSEESTTPVEESSVPEWLQEQPQPEDEKLEEAALPDWLQAIAAETSEPSVPAEETADVPEWLDISSTDAVETSEPTGEGVDLPQWLEETAGEEVTDVRVESLAGLESPAAQIPEEEVAAPAEESAPLAEASFALPGGGEDIDAALAWLESLAAKQGADEETLITRPEDRLDAPPEWVQQAEDLAAQSPVDVMPEIAEPIALEDNISEGAEAVSETVLAEVDIPEIVTEILPEVESPVEETVLPEAVSEFEPVIEEQAEELVPQAVEEVTQVMEDALVMEEDLPEITAVESPPVEEPALPVEEPAPEEKTQPVRVIHAEPTEGVVGIEEEEEEGELPAWLQDLSSYSTDLTGEEEETITAEWLSESELSGQRTAEVLSTEVIEAPAAVQPEPVVEEPASQPEMTEDTIIQSAEAPMEQVEAPTQPIAAQPQAVGPAADRLQHAQASLEKGDTATALAEYNEFIQDGELLEETIHDLRDALYRYPMDTDMWQTLGDAYMRGNRIQEALDAYTKAEELLR